MFSERFDVSGASFVDVCGPFINMYQVEWYVRGEHLEDDTWTCGRCQFCSTNGIQVRALPVMTTEVTAEVTSAPQNSSILSSDLHGVVDLAESVASENGASPVEAPEHVCNMFSTHLQNCARGILRQMFLYGCEQEQPRASRFGCFVAAPCASCSCVSTQGVGGIRGRALWGQRVSADF